MKQLFQKMPLQYYCSPRCLAAGSISWTRCWRSRLWGTAGTTPSSSAEWTPIHWKWCPAHSAAPLPDRAVSILEYKINDQSCANLVDLQGLCHQIRITWKWYGCKGLGMDMRRLIFKNFWCEPSIFNRHLKFSCLGSKRVQIFILFWTKIEAAINGFKLLYLGPEKILTFSAFFLIGCLVSRIFYNHCSIWVLKVSGVALERFRTQIEDNSLLNLCSRPTVNGAAPAIFRTQIEQILSHFEQPQIRFRTKWKIWMLFEPQLKKLKCL